MGKFEVGQRVNTTTDIYLANGGVIKAGTIGRVIKYDRIKLPVVRFEEADWELSLFSTSLAPAPDERAAGDVADVMCKCGYMASQHWADGECPGDGYPYNDAPENHVDVLATDNLLRMGLEKADECLALQDKIDTAEHELAVSKYTLSAVEGAADYLSKQVVEAESELATLRQQLAAVTERAERAERLLNKVEVNSPRDKPVKGAMSVYPNAWAFWVADELIRAYFKAQADGKGE